jgi:hypothetical protein
LKYTNFKKKLETQFDGVVVRSFCFGLILSPPLALIAKNRDFVSPFIFSPSLIKEIKVNDYPNWRDGRIPAKGK